MDKEWGYRLINLNLMDEIYAKNRNNVLLFEINNASINGRLSLMRRRLLHGQLIMRGSFGNKYS
jgi:hypothetical protein